MNRTLTSKSLLAAFLLVVLSASSISAAPPRGRARASKPATSSSTGFWEGVMQFLRKEGCGIDPNGRLCPTTATTPRPVDEGCTIDPNGCLSGN